MPSEGRVSSVAERIADAETGVRREQFIPGRFPYTYAYDFMRTHGKHFDRPSSRAEAAMALDVICGHTGEDREGAARSLAFAYCREWGIEVPDDEMAPARVLPSDTPTEPLD